MGSEQSGVQFHMHEARGCTERIDIARARDALHFRFERPRHLPQLCCTAVSPLAPQGESQDGNIVDAAGTHHGLQYAKTGWPPLLIRIDGVVQTHQRFRTLFTHLELDGQHRKARAGGRVEMLHARDFCEHLLHGRGDEAFHLGCRGAGERHQHVREGDIDLWFFFAWCYQHREHAGQQGQQRQQRRQLAVQEIPRQAPRKAEWPDGVHGVAPAGDDCCSVRRAALASTATWSPGASPARMLMRPAPCGCPARTWRRRVRPVLASHT